jgi:hypothetical protein
VSRSGIIDEGDRIFFITLRSIDGNSLAYAGWRKEGGTIRWTLTHRFDTRYIDHFSYGNDPVEGIWYSVELHWVRNVYSYGSADMYVNGVNVCHASGYDTNEFGAATTARFGLAETYGYTNSIVYADACTIQPTYVGGTE